MFVIKHSLPMDISKNISKISMIYYSNQRQRKSDKLFWRRKLAEHVIKYFLAQNLLENTYQLNMLEIFHATFVKRSLTVIKSYALIKGMFILKAEISSVMNVKRISRWSPLWWCTNRLLMRTLGILVISVKWHLKPRVNVQFT